MNKKKYKLPFLEIGLFILVFLVCLVLADVFISTQVFPLSDPLGWSRHDNRTDSFFIQDNTTNLRQVNVTYFNGFKRYGDVNSNKTKILIVGDSFTEMRFVNNGEEWYSYLEKNFDVELFVYGIGGYGTLQEYMVLNKTIDEIKPDVIIWQFYFNDFSNNYYEADGREYPFNNHGYRPYLENGNIVYRYPTTFSWLRGKSGISRIVFGFYDVGLKDTIPDHNVFFSKIYGEDFWKGNFSDALIYGGHFDRVQNVTTTILQMARRRSGTIPIYLFSADSRLKAAEESITQQANITYIPGVAEEVAQKNKETEAYVPNDGHWNKYGNQVAGEKLVRYFNETGVFKYH